MNADNIKDSIFKFLKLDNLISNLTGYIETRVELVKIEIREDVARILSQGIVYTTIIFFGLLFLLFFSIGLAHYLNTFFVGSFAGYWIVSGVYLLAFIVFLVFRKPINENFEKHFSEMIKRKVK
jgi:uncharacterized membrane protein YqjE